MNMTSEFTFRPMRRIKQQAAEEECLEILSTAKRGILAVNGDGGYPYAVPLNFVMEDGKIYFHCAQQGHKLDAIRADDKVSFCVLNEGTREPDSWWYHFTSVICFGRIRIVEDTELRDRLLRLLGGKYFPEGYDIDADMEKNGPRALVLELTIEHMTGKHIREK